MCLKDFCDEAILKFPPKLDERGNAVETYCNLALDYIARRMGYSGFHNSHGVPLMADEICSVLLRDWLAVDGESIARLAASGTLCVAAMSSTEIRAAAEMFNKATLKDARHGHVAVVYPVPRKEVPLLANVGKTNGVLGASRCFPAEPKYYYKPGGHPSTLGGNQ